MPDGKNRDAPRGGKAEAAARRERLAAELRANLGKRRRRKPVSGPEEKGEGVDAKKPG